MCVYSYNIYYITIYIFCFLWYITVYIIYRRSKKGKLNFGKGAPCLNRSRRSCDPSRRASGPSPSPSHMDLASLGLEERTVMLVATAAGLTWNNSPSKKNLKVRIIAMQKSAWRTSLQRSGQRQNPKSEKACDAKTSRSVLPAPANPQLTI